MVLHELISRNLPCSIEALLLDVTKDDTIETSATKVRQDHGKMDILVSNAAATPLDHTLSEKTHPASDSNATTRLASCCATQLSTFGRRMIHVIQGYCLS